MEDDTDERTLLPEVKVDSKSQHGPFGLRKNVFIALLCGLLIVLLLAIIVLAVVLPVALTSRSSAAVVLPKDPLERAKALLSRSPLIDG